MTKPITTLAVTVAPAAIVTDRFRPPPEAENPSPVSRGRMVVRLLYAFTCPVSSLPVPAVAYGEVARNCSVVEPLPLFLMDRLVTATLLSVMNLVWLTVIEPAVCTLFQWLGACQRWETCSVKVPGLIATV
ncbi:hypothetical protein [Streptomyces bluensis]|uniref:Uncharacterized protein n=1 Tax=Streptomyces bluensis TaxID=33897 RepID=A0ABW6UBT5_9ACTN